MLEPRRSLNMVVNPEEWAELLDKFTPRRRRGFLDMMAGPNGPEECNKVLDAFRSPSPVAPVDAGVLEQ